MYIWGQGCAETLEVKHWVMCILKVHDAPKHSVSSYLRKVVGQRSREEGVWWMMNSFADSKGETQTCSLVLSKNLSSSMHSGLLPFGWLNEVDTAAFLFTFRHALLYSPHPCPHHGRNTSAQCAFCYSNSSPTVHFNKDDCQVTRSFTLAELHLNLTEWNK